MNHKSYEYSSQFIICVEQRFRDGWYSAHIYDNEGDVAWDCKTYYRERDEAWEVACNQLDAMTEKWLEETESAEDDGTPPSEDQMARENGVSSYRNRL